MELPAEAMGAEVNSTARQSQPRDFRRPFILKPAVGLSTDFTDFTDGLDPEAPPLRRFHVTRRVKRQPLSTGFQSVESVQSVDPTAFSRFSLKIQIRGEGGGSCQFPEVSCQSGCGEESAPGAGRLNVFSVPFSSPEGATGESPGWNPGVALRSALGCRLMPRMNLGSGNWRLGTSMGQILNS